MSWDIKKFLPFVLVFLLGYFLFLCTYFIFLDKEQPKFISQNRTVQGLRFEAEDYIEAKDTALKNDPKGDWVCVNVDNMDYKRCVEVSQHECGHEIFAEILETHPEKIDKVMEALNE